MDVIDWRRGFWCPACKRFLRPESTLWLRERVRVHRGKCREPVQRAAQTVRLLP